MNQRTTRRARDRIAPLAACLLLAAPLGHAQHPVPDYRPVTDERLRQPADSDWLMYLRTYDSWAYSPLDSIHTRNVRKLTPVWTMSTGASEGHMGHPTNRGVALYGDKVYMATSDAQVVALAAATGDVIWQKSVEDYNGDYYMTLAPLAAEGKIMVGVSGGERGICGFVVALDAETGDEVWKTYTIPGPGEPGNDTWPGESWRTGGAPVWITGSYDPALKLTYWGTGNPGPWTGDARPGDNLYTSSVVALDVATGKLAGYHQYHWNDSWDWDEVAAPLLIDLPRNGRTVQGLVHAGRNGYLWFLERSASGISFIDAKPYVAQNVFTRIDPRTGRPESDPARKPAVGFRAVFCPSLWGGKDWPPAAYNPRTGYLYIPANENLCQEMEGEEVEYRRGQQFTGASMEFQVVDGADHIGELQAWNVRTRERVWAHEFQSPNWGPVLSTAGGLVFAGGTSDRYFRAFDAESGELLWQHRTNSGITGVPTSFEVDGVQYVAVQSGWGVDAQGMLGRIDRARGTTTIVPQGGVVWVFALEP